jgi:hypothetical protein
MEIYVGIYLVLGIFIGGSTLMSAIMYWQMVRLRYMVSVPTQLAFQRLDQSL